MACRYCNGSKTVCIEGISGCPACTGFGDVNFQATLDHFMSGIHITKEELDNIDCVFRTFNQAKQEVLSYLKDQRRDLNANIHYIRNLNPLDMVREWIEADEGEA